MFQLNFHLHRLFIEKTLQGLLPGAEQERICEYQYTPELHHTSNHFHACTNSSQSTLRIFIACLDVFTSRIPCRENATWSLSKRPLLLPTIYWYRWKVKSILLEKCCFFKQLCFISMKNQIAYFSENELVWGIRMYWKHLLLRNAHICQNDYFTVRFSSCLLNIGFILCWKNVGTVLCHSWLCVETK